MAEEGKYVYGVISTDKEPKFGSIGIGGRHDEIYTISHRGIGAVLSNSSAIEYDVISKETLGRYLASHQFVVEQVMKNYAVIPVKFGTMVRDDDEVREIIEAGYTQFKGALKAMENKIELDMVALWSNLDLVFQEIGAEEEIKRFKEQIALKPPGETLEGRIRIGQMVKASLDGRRDQYAGEILAVLKDQAEDFRLHESGDDSMIINVAFLLDRDKEEKFDEKVNELNEKYEEKVNFRCVGPLPPYSFGTMEVKRVGLELLDEARKSLELDQEATLSQIKEAHRRLTHKHHPDKNLDDPQAEEGFKRISDAYRLLTDYCQNYRHSFRQEDAEAFITVNPLKIGGNGEKGMVRERGNGGATGLFLSS